MKNFIGRIVGVVLVVFAINSAYQDGGRGEHWHLWLFEGAAFAGIIIYGIYFNPPKDTK